MDEISKLSSITKKEAFKEINDTQDYYINELIEKLNDKELDYLKEINFSSPTGTGKTNMMALLIKKMPDYFFLVTTLSKGQLNVQVENKLKSLCKDHNNFKVYGVASFTSNTKLQAEDILNILPKDDTKVIWLRDEGHINTNKWSNLLTEKCDKIVNFSATNKEGVERV